MKISELTKTLQSEKQKYGNLDVRISINISQDENENDHDRRAFGEIDSFEGINGKFVILCDGKLNYELYELPDIFVGDIVQWSYKHQLGGSSTWITKIGIVKRIKGENVFVKFEGNKTVSKIKLTELEKMSEVLK